MGQEAQCLNDMSVCDRTAQCVSDISVWNMTAQCVNDISVWNMTAQCVNDISVWDRTAQYGTGYRSMGQDSSVWSSNRRQPECVFQDT